MKKMPVLLAETLLLIIASTSLLGKGDVVRIIISRKTLAAPIEITDPAIVSHFNVWSGPGTSSNEAKALNVDWSRGVANPPNELENYEVSFVTSRSDPSTYVVRYAVDPATKIGYVYIPGKSDAGYADNVFLIYRGIEGKWFYASRDWQRLADPLISKARRSH